MREVKLSYEQTMDLLRMPIGGRKDYIQDVMVDYIAKHRHVLLEAYAGFGKTTTVVKLCRRFRLKHDHPIVIVVPTKTLKGQWEKDLAEFSNVHVYVVNQYTMSHDESVIRVCGIFVADEGHTMLNATNQYFHKALRFAKPSFTCVLSATISNDHKAFLMKCNIENCFKLPIEMGKRLELLPPYAHVNFYTPLSEMEAQKYVAYNRVYKNYCDMFAPLDVKSPYDPKLKMEGKCAKMLSLDIKAYRGAVFLYGDAFRKRKQIIETSSTKRALTLEILEAFSGEKALVYGENTKFLDYLADHDHRVCRYYTDTLKSEKKRKNALAAFEHGILPYMASCKAVKLGFNDEQVYLGIRTSYTSSETDLNQQIGRVTRLDRKWDGKQALFINLVTPNLYTANGDMVLESYEVGSLSYQQRELKDIQWISEKEELFELISQTIQANKRNG